MDDKSSSRTIDEAVTEAAIFGDLRREGAQALLLLGELRDLTRWDEHVICRRLGCEPERWANFDGQPDRRTSAEGLFAASILFLTLVRDAARLVDLASDRRRVLVGACQVSRSLGGPIEKRVDAIKNALEARSNGLSGWDLLSLGEVERAWRLAERSVDYGQGRQRSLEAEKWTETVADSVTHISPSRLAALSQRDAVVLLGSEVVRRMQQHVAMCRTCEDALSAWQARRLPFSAAA